MHKLARLLPHNWDLELPTSPKTSPQTSSTGCSSRISPRRPMLPTLWIVLCLTLTLRGWNNHRREAFPLVVLFFQECLSPLPQPLAVRIDWKNRNTNPVLRPAALPFAAAPASGPSNTARYQTNPRRNSNVFPACACTTTICSRFATPAAACFNNTPRQLRARRLRLRMSTTGPAPWDHGLSCTTAVSSVRQIPP